MTSPPHAPTPDPGDHDADVAAAKRACRVIAREARCALDPRACLAAADALADLLLALPELEHARLVLAYSATDEEISLGPAIDRLRARGVDIAYPRIEERGVLAVHLAEDDAELVSGPMGIREPSADAPRPDLTALDAVIVPGVAFDERGVRVGFGGGFYDRLLPLVAGAVRIGVAYDEQLSAQPLPAEPHDVVMDVVVTPTETFRSSARKPPARRA